MTAIEPTTARPPSPAALYLIAVRPGFLTASAVPVLLGLAGAVYAGVAIDAVRAVYTLVGAVLIHAGVNVLNDYYDAANGTDQINTERIYPFTGGSRLIQNGLLSSAETLQYGLLLVGAGSAIGLALAALAGPALLAIGLIGIMLGWTYSAPPLFLSGRGLGELAVAIGFGLLIPVGTDYVQREALSTLPVITGAPYALLVANILLINQFPDRTADARTGKHHWVVRLGPARAHWLYSAQAALAALLLLAAISAGGLPPLALAALTAWVPAAFAARGLLINADRPQRLAGPIRATIAASVIYGVVLAGVLTLTAIRTH